MILSENSLCFRTADVVLFICKPTQNKVYLISSYLQGHLFIFGQGVLHTLNVLLWRFDRIAFCEYVCYKVSYHYRIMCGWLSIHTMSVIMVIERHNTVRCGFNAVNFITNIHKRHPMARPLGRGMGCLLWIQHLIDIMSQFLQLLVQNFTILDRVITAPDCKACTL